MTRSSFKGKGLGKTIVHMALQRVRGAGYDGAVAFVTEGNIPSERLLVGLGFRRVG
jgi:L-amino acid N-acyltransferase YncA